MAYDIELGDRIRLNLEKKRNIIEKNMFGGLAFMYHGKMFIGVIKDKLVVRVGPKKNEEALSKPYTSQMDFTGKPMNGYVYVEKEGLMHNTELSYWVESGLSFVKSLLKTEKVK